MAAQAFVCKEIGQELIQRQRRMYFHRGEKCTTHPHVSGLFKKYSRSRWTGPQIVCYAESALGD